MAILKYAPYIFFAALLTGCKVKDYPSDSRPIQHLSWDSLLAKHVSDEGWVDYQGFIRDSSQLDDYLNLLSNHHPNDQYWSREERMAYWINAYNAYTVKLITRHYPIAGIKDIKNGIPFVNTVWDIKFIDIEGATYDLNNIEHGILRAKYDEPRIHFALNCASVSCPKLLNEAFTAERLDEQLNRAGREFLANPLRNKIEPDHARLSKIFSWYKGDFTENTSLIEYLNRFAPVNVQADAQIDYLDYNWSLNEQGWKKNSNAE